MTEAGRHRRGLFGIVIESEMNRKIAQSFNIETTGRSLTIFIVYLHVYMFIRRHDVLN